MSRITDALYIPAKCGKTKNDFYIVCYKAFDGTWVETYGKASPPVGNSPDSGKPESVQLGRTRRGPQYTCPHCGQRYHFRCWNCGQWTCYDGDNHDGREVWCPHCGKRGVFASRPNSGGSSSSNRPTMIRTSGQ